LANITSRVEAALPFLRCGQRKRLAMVEAGHVSVGHMHAVAEAHREGAGGRFEG